MTRNLAQWSMSIIGLLHISKYKQVAYYDIEMKVCILRLHVIDKTYAYLKRRENKNIILFIDYI